MLKNAKFLFKNRSLEIRTNNFHYLKQIEILDKRNKMKKCKKAMSTKSIKKSD